MALRDRKRCLDAALASNAAELGRAMKVVRKSERAAARAWQLPEPIRRATIIAYALAEYNVQPAIKLLVASGRRRHWPDKAEDELVAIVEDLFLAVDVVELSGLTDLEAPADLDAMKLAVPYVEQWRLCAWATELNESKGVAPSTEAVLVKLESQRVALPDVVRPAARGTVADAAARVWATRFRRRWGGRHGRIKCRDYVPTDEMVSKAVCVSVGVYILVFSIFGRPFGRARGAKRRARFRPQFQPRAPLPLFGNMSFIRARR